MALKIFKNKGETNSIPINANNLNYNFTEILNLVYPIGRGFIDFTDTDYSNYLGFTWDRELVGMTAVGLDTTQTEFNSVGKIGGEKTHTLTVGEMPKHSHSALIGGDGDKYASPFVTKGNNLYYVPTNEAGNNQAHNNLQPYQVVAYWKRIA